MFERGVVIFLYCCVSLGIAQILNNLFVCDYKQFEFLWPCRRRPYGELTCQSHVVLLTNISILAFNESEQTQCCSRLPSEFCSTNSIEYFNYISNKFLQHRVYIRYHPHMVRSLSNNCSASEYMLHVDYTCVTNSTIVNMTHAGVNTSIGELSLSYSHRNYPKIEDYFHCSCEVSASEDTSIYPTVYLINFYRSDTSLDIYARNLLVKYDGKSRSIQNVLYKSLQSTKGPVKVVYHGKKIPNSDKIWVSFRVNRGLIKTKCDGCKKGKYQPPPFDDESLIKTKCDGCKKGKYQPPPFDDTNDNGKDEIATIASSKSTIYKVDTKDGYKSAFISLMVLLIIAGIGVVVAYVYWRRRGKEWTGLLDTCAGVFKSGEKEEKRVGEREGATRQEDSTPATVNDIYDGLERTQPSDDYDCLNRENIYENQASA